MKPARQLDFFVIGAQKAGTTSVHMYLSKHKDIYLPPEKEAPFFSDDELYSQGYDRYIEEFFSGAKNQTLWGTVTPSYMMSAKTPYRIREICPHAKFIAILRDPIERAYSHYNMATRVRGEKRTFEEAMAFQLQQQQLELSRKAPDAWRDFIVFGEYGRILSDYFRCFPKEQQLILFMDELEQSPDIFISRIFKFLGIQNTTIENLGQRYHASNVNKLLSYLAYLGLNTKLRLLGKMLPNRMRRRFRFWLGLYRSNKQTNLDTSFTLSTRLRTELEKHYRKDAKIVNSFVANEPYWIRNWGKE